MERFEQGDAWVLEGALDPINFGSNCNVGLAPERRPPWIKWEDVRAGGYDPVARIGEQDQDGVDAEILYPTPRVSNQLFWNVDDVDFHLTCIQAYNDWLSEFCAYAPDRLWGVAMLPNVGVDHTLAELERARALPGMGGAMLGQYPHGGGVIAVEDDGLWAAAEAMEIPLSIHVGFALAPAADKGRMQRVQASGVVRFTDAPIRIAQFVDSGVFDRYPNLHLVLVEVDSGWLPYLREQMNDRFKRSASRPDIARLPGDYFETNLFSTFITDRYALKNRHDIGVSQMLWSSDYPHSGADWPNSWTTIEDHFAGVPDDEKHAILAGNAARLYGSRAVVATPAGR
jgi:predicted TIM-barrel fold metal-dependent hydrolase